MIAFYENRTKDFEFRDNTDGRRHLRCAAHLHYHIELVLLLKGKTTAYADTECCPLSDGDVFLAFPNRIHRYESVGEERFFLLIVNPDFLAELSDVFSAATPVSAKIEGAARDPEILHLTTCLAALNHVDEPYADVLRRGYMLVLFSRLLAKTQLRDTPSGDIHALRSVVSYCTKNYTKELTLTELEKELHISKYYISHLFSEKLKIGFNDYVNSLRVSFACRYLRHTDKSITEIASLVGFGTLRTFNRAFAKQMNQTPSEYRRNAVARRTGQLPANQL